MEQKLTPEQQFSMALAEYVGCQKPFCLLRRADKEMLSTRSFDMEYNRVVNAIANAADEKDRVRRYRDKAAQYAIGSPGLEVVRTICYRPGGDSIIDHKFNMWTDPKTEPLPEKPKIFLDHLNYLIPSRAERILLLSWLAWIVQHPEQKVMYAIMIIGSEGTGKSWLGKVMERIFGADNVVLVSEEDALTSTFNGFSENKRLCFVHETPAKQMADLLDKLKGLITEKDVLINRKGIERYKADNFANLLAVCNEEVPMKLTNRRWAMIRANDDPFGVDNRGNPTPQHEAHYTKIWSVIPDDGTITDELRRILWYLRAIKLDTFNHLVPPMTGTKNDAAVTAASGEDNVLAHVLEARKDREGPFRFDLLTQEDVRDHCGGTLGKDLAAIMQQAGCRMIRKADGGRVQVRFGADKPRRQLWAIGKDVADKHHKTDPADLRKEYQAERAAKPKVAPMAGADVAGDFE